MRIALIVFGLVAAVHLGAQLAGHRPVVDASQILLVPPLAAALWLGTRAPRGPLVVLMMTGLGFSWLGDSVPRFLTGDAAFLVMIGFFLVAQVLYAVAFWPYRSRSAITRPLLMLPYVGGAVVIILLCASATGPLLPALIAYAVAIMAMAIFATGLGRRATLGGVLFVVSDALIALNVFGVLSLPGHEFLAMAGYTSAQLLLVLGVHDEWRSAHRRTEATAQLAHS